MSKKPESLNQTSTPKSIDKDALATSSKTKADNTEIRSESASENGALQPRKPLEATYHMLKSAWREGKYLLFFTEIGKKIWVVIRYYLIVQHLGD